MNTGDRILTWATPVLFGSNVRRYGSPEHHGDDPWIGILIHTTLTAVTFGSILMGIPFTLQYSREMVDPPLWENPVFIRVNILMTGGWGGIFAINLLLDCVNLITPEFFGEIVAPLMYLTLVTGVIFTIVYPGYVQRKYSRAPFPCT
jgi:hypothetical protein